MGNDNPKGILTRSHAPRGRNRGLGIDWDFRNMSGLINNRGEDVIHEIGMRCTCNNEDLFAGQMEQTHVPRRRRILGCSRCSSDGYIFRNPKKIVGLVTSISEDQVQTEGGWGVTGDCLLSTHPGYTISAGDLITFTWAQPVPDGQVLVRGAASSSDNLERKTFLEENEDRLWYYAASSIWCEDEDGVVYGPGSFQLDGSKIIRWGGNSPSKGKKYTIKYDAFLEWVVFQPPAIRRDQNRSLGDRVMLKKSHTVLTAEDPRPRANEKVPFCTRIQGC